MDGYSASQFEIDFRTQRPTAISVRESCDRQRAACAAINRDRKSRILEAARADSPGESVSADVWNAAFARRALELDVPLIPLGRFGLQRSSEGLHGSDLIALKPGAEASPYLDREHGVVYKLFDLRPNGSLGKRFELVRSSDAETPGVPDEDRYSIKTRDATLLSTLHKLAYLNEAGGHPTEIVGLTTDGDFLIAKQPLAQPVPAKDFVKAREIAVQWMKGVEIRRIRLEKMVVALWVRNEAALMSDLHTGNVMCDGDGRPTIIDALLGTFPPAALTHLPPIRHAFENAEAWRRGRPTEPRGELIEGNDDEL